MSRPVLVRFPAAPIGCHDIKGTASQARTFLVEIRSWRRISGEIPCPAQPITLPSLPVMPFKCLAQAVQDDLMGLLYVR